ncbi:hypothetical protein AAG570_005547 [Ranatra chinensis]|uniref:Alpha-carbonic anhydrase domain-containing protein n=1 Tax=Ranatra chinensis TaxID=642074 RepID=A0ABD0XYR7_9HEMI
MVAVGFIFLVFVVSVRCERASPGWPEELPYFPKGRRQSPINIVPEEAVPRQLPPLTIQVADLDEKVDLKNDGHTLTVTLRNENKVHPAEINLRGGPLSGIYTFNNYHLHWGDVGELGSEHAIDGVKFQGEMHGVFYSLQCDNMASALKYPDGIAVLSMFLELSPRNIEEHNTSEEMSTAVYATRTNLEQETNNYLVNADNSQEANCSCEPIATISKLAKQVKEPGSSVQMNSSLALEWMQHLQRNEEMYFTYPGSLTTKPFSENVIFIVFPKPLPVRREEMDEFRTLQSHGHGPIRSNWRRLQAKNKRPVAVVGSKIPSSNE